MDDTPHRWPCSACGADLRYAPGQTRLTCDHCGHVEDIPAAALRDRKTALGEHDLDTALRGALPGTAMEEPRTTRCASCGALVEFQGAQHATECPFCASPVAVGTGTNRQIKPQALVPFRLTEGQAREAMTKWLGNLWFAPSGLVDYARKGRAMTGLYTPYWTFDAASRSRYAGQRGTYYYETRTVTVQVNGRPERRQEQVRKTRWQPVSGWVARDFDDVLVLASTSLPQGYTDALAPWDLGALEPFRPDYLAGFTAEGYTVALPDGHARARRIMDQVIQGDVIRAIGGDEQRIDRIASEFSLETFKHILLPVWMAAYKYNGRTFRFVVNGQTGKVRGERPWSAVKIALAAIVVAALVGAAVWFGSQG